MCAFMPARASPDEGGGTERLARLATTGLHTKEGKDSSRIMGGSHTARAQKGPLHANDQQN
jgi:hypothetical protein